MILDTGMSFRREYDDTPYGDSVKKGDVFILEHAIEIEGTHRTIWKGRFLTGPCCNKIFHAGEAWLERNAAPVRSDYGRWEQYVERLGA
jgi:hypothetical protein